MKRLLTLFVILILTVLAAVSCDIKSGDEEKEEKTHRVMVVADDGFSITSQNPLDVKTGENAVFDVKIADGFVFSAIENGVYDQDTGKITVSNVQSNVRVTFSVTEVDYDTSKSYVYFFKGGKSDTSSLISSRPIKAGTSITVVAGDESNFFAGWSVGATLSGGGKLVSTDRTFTFHIGPEMSINGSSINLFSNYVSNNVYYYDVNGGVINKSSTNVTHTKYYTVEQSSGKLKVSLGSKYFEKVGVASTFWDDGTFTREGYVLIEYNTKPDGTGESYGLGSKYYIEPKGGSFPTLYCIWAKDTSHSDFTYTSHNYTYKSGVNSTRAPHWSQNGIKITSYTGNADTVVIPEKIDGKFVTGIAAGAFKNKNVKTLVLNKRILEVADGAFVGCSKLETVYYPDGLYSIGDAAFDAATYSSFKNFYVNATMGPRNSTSERGALSIKLARLLSSQDYNRVIVVAGSSAHQSLGSQYLETLFDGKYKVVNLGTVRVSTALVYYEALGHYVHEGDVAIIAPENYIGMFGCTQIVSSLLTDTENMLNVFWHIDISNYTKVFSAFSAFARSRYSKNASVYEAICDVEVVDQYGDQQKPIRQYYCEAPGSKEYVYRYIASFTNRFKTRDIGEELDDYNSSSYCSADDPKYKDQVNRVIRILKASGAGVYFGYCPTDEGGLPEEAKDREWLAAYDKWIDDNYEFDGRIGKAENFIYNHTYGYDCNYHLNDYGRTYHTYQNYVDICKTLGIEQINGMYDFGTVFNGCIFETGSDGTPIKKVDFLNNR